MQKKPLVGLVEFQAFLGTEVNWRSALTESNLETANGILAGIEFGDQVPKRTCLRKAKL